MTALNSLSAEKRQLLQKQLRDAGRKNWAQPIRRRNAEERVLIAPEQRNVWLHAAMAPNVPLYNEAVTLHYRGDLDRCALKKSLATFMQRHEAWRTSFSEIDGALHQIVHADPGLDIPLSDLTALPEAERERVALDLATEDARQPFDLTSAPLLRARLVRLSADYHRLYLTLHHIIFDGVTIYRIFLPEFSKLYATYAAGQAPFLPPPSLQYGDYAVWRTRQIAESSMEREIAYWREQLSGEIPQLRLPVDRPRPPQQTYAGSMETFALGHERTAALKALARDEGVTLYVVLLAAFKALLHRYSGQEDIVIGGVTDTRRRPELAAVAGNFLNSLPLRTRPRSELSFRDYLAQVQQRVIAALDASNLPFDRMVREAKTRREGHPLFQTLFSVEPPAPPPEPGWDLTQMDVTVGAAKFDLYLEIDERPEGLIARFLYSTELFDADTIHRMIGHWVTVLDGVAANPQCTLRRLPLLTAQERQALLHDVNATGAEYNLAMLPAQFDIQARKTPDRIAVTCDGRELRYGELRQRVAALTGQLKAAGVRRGDLVAVMLERSPDLVASLIAVMRCGAAYLPLDFQLPERRLAMLLEDASPAFLLTQASLSHRIPQTQKTKTILCDDEAEGPQALHPIPECNVEDVAYILYTSGSTGKPKAVEIRHRALANLLAAIQSHVQPGARDRLLAVTTLSFDIAALELFLPLVTGATLILATEDQAHDPAKLIPLIDDATIMQATPATWRGLIALGWSGSRKLKILCGGEALGHELAQQLLDRAECVWNVYGPTETTIWSLIHKVQAEENPVPIGRPLANTTVHVLDVHGEPVPAGVTAELYIGGHGVARGYRNAPELTAAKFCEMPPLGRGRLYRTGDFVRFRSDGVLEFAGRSDNQVKIRGFRVGLEEVEAALARHPDVAAAATAAFPDVSGELSLVAFVVPKEGKDPELLGFLREFLPGYMVPQRFVTLPSLPMTPNGKVDRRRLVAPAEPERHRIAEPRDSIERGLADLWARFLNVRCVGRHDDFFELGGHSLLAAMLIGQINKTMDRDLPMSALFRAPTIAGLAEILRKAEQPHFSHLVQFRAGRTRWPLFIVHGIFGNVMQLRPLAERLNTDRPVYALQASGADLRQQPQRTIAEMAGTYIDAIRAVQPSGPYALAGYSFGGLIAYEMACRLRRAGEDIEFLGLLETEVSRRNHRLSERMAHRWGQLGRAARNLQQLPLRNWTPYLLDKVVEMAQHLVRRDYINELDNTHELPEAVLQRNRAMYATYEKEFFAYGLPAYAGKVTLFRTSHAAFHVFDPLPVCRRLAQDVDVVAISGTHDTIMDAANVGGLAQELSRCLADGNCCVSNGLRSGARLQHRKREIEAATT